jgi:ATP-binding protein involved in chromosome partitioning
MPQRPINLSSNIPPIAGVKHIIAVGSGKGGVGKSTVALNLALALQHQKLNIGLLDADIYGPNQAYMLDSITRADVEDNKLQPIISHGLQTMTMSYLMDQDTPVIWRGPMVTKMLYQMLFATHWQEVDVLIIDLPPGTGDVPLTLSKKAPLTGVVIVTTPQTLATADAEKGINMFKKVDVPILGIIENMSGHTCSQCGHHDPVFGTDGAQQLSIRTETQLLGQIPLDSRIRQASDNGQPIVLEDPQHPASTALLNIAEKLCNTHDLHRPDKKSTFPKIVVE